MRFKLKSPNNSIAYNSDAFPEGIWVNANGKAENELDLGHIYALEAFKYPRIYLLLKELIRTEFGSATATFQDFKGKEIQAYIHSKAFTLYYAKISIGNLFELVDVSVFALEGAKQLFLDAPNIAMIVIAKDYSVVKMVDLPPSSQIIASTATPTSIAKPTKSSGRLRLSDVQPLEEKTSFNSILPRGGKKSNSSDQHINTNQPTLDDYDLLNQELKDDFEDY